ncbi:MAG: S8/S53 family peptidase [Actinobacteria bacterium]|nr:S8/S53 family peptidase [Actinomycetota bacterium]
MRTIRATITILLAAAVLLPVLPRASASPVVVFCVATKSSYEWSNGDCAPKGPQPIAVVALIDTGINPYSPAFRDTSKLAYKHPSKYIPGYPKDAKALRLSLDLPYDKALKEDADVWNSVTRGDLYWIPGTRIAGAISFGEGGTNCPVVSAPPANAFQQNCDEDVIFDDHGHGTMTASRAAGAPNSLAPTARIVEIEGLGARGVEWAAQQGWIDVQSNSWLSLIPPPVPSGTTNAFAFASKRMLTMAASGNGTAYLAGFAPTPTYALSTAPPGVVLVGGHDNGKMTLWAGAPPHVVADAYAGMTATRSAEAMKPDPIACCTSAASPYAAGGATAIVLEARRLLRDKTPGTKDGLVACGRPTKKGPLDDGRFTLDELKSVLLHTAQPHPAEGVDDGDVHWAGDPRAPDRVEYGPGANPFCFGCTTMPVPWQAIPSVGDSTYPLLGYGGINEHSVLLAKDVLVGKVRLPDRPSADAQYAADQALREEIFSSRDDGGEVKPPAC